MESFSEPDQEESQLSLTETIKTAPQTTRFPILNYDFKVLLTLNQPNFYFLLVKIDFSNRQNSEQLTFS